MTMGIVLTVLFSVASFFAAPILFSRSKFRFGPLISPLNWFLLLFGLKLVIVPLAVLAWGESTRFLPYRPSAAAVNTAICLNVLAFWSFSAAVQVFRKSQARGGKKSTRPTAPNWTPPLKLIAVFAVLGVAGIAYRFQSFGNLIDYFADPQTYLFNSQAGAQSGDDGAAGGGIAVLLMYFLPFSAVMLWCREQSRKNRRRGILSRLLPPALIVVIALSSSLSSYSRTLFVMPLIAIAAVMTRQGVSANILKYAALGVFGIGLVVVISSYRMFFTAGGDMVSNEVDMTEVSDMFQDYGSAPQFLAVLIESNAFHEDPGLGRVLFSSILSPVPVVGKPFRQYAGNSVYARMMGREDQPAPFVGELYLDFSVIGVAVGLFAVGGLVAALENRFDLATEPLAIYVVQFTSLCCSYFVVCGMAEVAQFATYLFWPIYCLLLYRKLDWSGGFRVLSIAMFGAGTVKAQPGQPQPEQLSGLQP
jgi:oligosaccharide repeat unit polymerase